MVKSKYYPREGFILPPVASAVHYKNKRIVANHYKNTMTTLRSHVRPMGNVHMYTQGYKQGIDSFSVDSFNVKK